MALICDTSGIYALYDKDDADHSAVVAAIQAEQGDLFLPVILLAEIDYLFQQRLGANAAVEFLEAVEQGDFELVPLTTSDLSRCREVVEQYRDMRIGLADATVVAAAERLKVDRVLTLDQRHFRSVAPRGFAHFVLVPFDQA